MHSRVSEFKSRVSGFKSRVSEFSGFSGLSRDIPENSGIGMIPEKSTVSGNIPENSDWGVTFFNSGVNSLAGCVISGTGMFVSLGMMMARESSLNPGEEALDGGVSSSSTVGMGRHEVRKIGIGFGFGIGVGMGSCKIVTIDEPVPIMGVKPAE